MSSNYFNDHKYDDKKSRIFKIIEFVTITLAITCIGALIAGPVIGALGQAMKFHPDRFMIFTIILVTGISWAGFYAYGAYNSMYSIKVEKRSSSLGPFPVIMAIGFIALIPWLIQLLPYSWRKFGMTPPLLFGWQDWVFVAIVVIGAPIFEELAFRKNLLPGLVKTYGYWGAVFVSALAFGIAHGNVVQFIPGLLLGSLAAYVYLQSGSIFHCMALHAIYNAGILLIPRFGGLPIAYNTYVIIGASLVLVGLVGLAVTHKPFDRKSEEPTSGRRPRRSGQRQVRFNS